MPGRALRTKAARRHNVGMPRFLPLVALAVLSLFWAGCGDDEPGVERIQFDAERALGFATHLAEEIGPRPAGSQAAKDAAAYIAGEFANARFGVFSLEFEYEANPNRPASVSIAGRAAPAARERLIISPSLSFAAWRTMERHLDR